MYKGDRLWERGGAPSTMVEIGGSGESVEGHGRRYFGGNKGAAVAGIRKTWQEQGRVYHAVLQVLLLFGAETWVLMATIT